MLRQFYEAVLPAEGRYALFLVDRKEHIFCDDMDALVCETERLHERTDVFFATCTLGDKNNRKVENGHLRNTICFDIDAGPEKYAKHGDKVYETQELALAALVQWIRDNKFFPHRIISSGQGLHVYFRFDTDLGVEAWQPLADGVKAKALADGLRIDAGITGDFVRILRPVGSLHHSGNLVTTLKELPKTYSPEQVAAKFPAPVRSSANTGGAKRRLNDEILSAPTFTVPRTIHRIVASCEAMNHVARTKGDVPEPYWRLAIGIAKHTVEGVGAAHSLSCGHPEYDHYETEAKFNRWSAGPSTCDSFAAENPEACAACPHRGAIKSPIVLGAMEAGDLPPGKLLPPPAAASEDEGEDTPFASDDDDSPFASDDDEPPAQTREFPWEGHLPEGTAVRPIPGGYGMFRVEEVPIIGDDGKPTKEKRKVEVMFSGTPFWIHSWAESTGVHDPALGGYSVYNAARGTVTEYYMSQAVRARRDSLLAELAARNIHPMSENSKKTIENFVRDSFERIRSTGLRHKIADRFGVYTDTDMSLYVAHGEHLIYPNGEIRLGMAKPELKDTASKYIINLPQQRGWVWAPTVWDSHIRPRAHRYVDYLRETIRDDQPEFKLAIMLSLASPLIPFTKSYGGGDLPAIGFTVSLFSEETGMGKSLCMSSAAMGYGRWDIPRDDNNASSTKNFRGAKLAQCGTLPGFMDEAGDGTQAADLHDLIKGIGNGRVGRGRMQKDQSLKEPAPTSFVNLMATNRSIRELIASVNEGSNAAAMRMLEINCSNMPKVDKSQGSVAEARRTAAADTHGCFGAVIHYRIAQLGLAKTTALVADCCRVADEILGEGNEGRIMAKALGAMLALRRIMKAEGLELWDGKELQSEFKKWYEESMRFGKQTTVSNAIVDQVTRMLMDIQKFTLITDEMSVKDKHVMPRNDRVPDQIEARIATATGEACVHSATIRRWCRENDIGVQSFLSRAQAAGLILTGPDGAKPKPGEKNPWERKMDLAKGTIYSKRVATRVVVFNLNRLGTGAETGFLDLADAPAEVLPIARKN